MKKIETLGREGEKSFEKEKEKMLFFGMNEVLFRICAF